MRFRVGGVYPRKATNKHGARRVRCVYAADGHFLLRNLENESPFFEMLHPGNPMAFVPYLDAGWLEQNE